MRNKVFNAVFNPSGKRLKVKYGEDILTAARNSGIDIKSLCGGQGYCHQCRINTPFANYPKHGFNFIEKNLSNKTLIEEEVFKGKDNTHRLACQTKIYGDIVIEVPDKSRELISAVKKPSVLITEKLNPALKVYFCTLEQPTLSSNPADAENLLLELAKQDLDVSLDSRLLSCLQPLLKKHHRKLAVVVQDGKKIIALQNPEQVNLYGAAIDIGSTTLAFYIYDLLTGDLLYETSTMNPQISYGEDLMSRVSFAMLNKDGDKLLTSAIQNKTSEVLTNACNELKIDVDNLLQLVLVGNPIMQSLFLGVSPIPLGQAPFTLTNRFWIDIAARELNIKLAKTARVSFLPLIAGHVGADMSAAYLTQMDKMNSKTTLLVDIGTNAEIVLQHKNKIAATSSPTGPAFEGAEISHGVRASIGAIERVRIDKGSLKTKVKIIGNDNWSDELEFKKSNSKIIGICGSGIFEAMVELASSGVIDKSGLFVKSRCPDRFFRNEKNILQFLLYEDKDNKIYIEQTDIRAIQLAKAALYAGAKLLMNYLQCKKLEKVLIAGAFGNHLDAKYIADIGIVPKIENNNIETIGNAAGEGAAMALINCDNKAKIIKAVDKIDKIESAIEPKFQEYFVSAMSFPTSKITAIKNIAKSRRRIKKAR